MQIPVAEPVRAVQSERASLDEALASVLDTGRYVHGPEHEAFEHELAQYVGVDHCLGVASGTDALELALRAIGCGPDDELVTAANAGFYSSAAALAIGLDVRYADVDPVTLTLTAETLEPSLTPATRAVVVTHLYGTLADMPGLLDLCRERGVGVIEDCAQAIGAERDGRRAGSFGEAAAFSFYPTKNLAALGDAGAVLSRDPDLASRVRSLRQYGWQQKYRVVSAGGRNSRLDEVQAAILRTRLPRLEQANERRRAIVGEYVAALSPSAGRFVMTEGSAYVAHLAVILVHNRDGVRSQLAAAGVGTDVHYPIADHRQPVWGERHSNVRLPVTEDAVERVVTIPCYETLRDDEVRHICQALREL